MISERNIAVLLRRVGVVLVLEHFQGADQAGAGLVGFDDVVDVAAGGGDVGVGQTFAVVAFEAGAQASGSSEAASSSRKTMLTAPSMPMTAISAVGQARLRSPRMCLLDITSYAPPYALRVITVSFGTVASQYAYSSFAPWRMIPPCSWATPAESPARRPTSPAEC